MLVGKGIQGSKGVNPAVSSKVMKLKKKAYILIGRDIHGLNGINPISSEVMISQDSIHA